MNLLELYTRFEDLAESITGTRDVYLSCSKIRGPYCVRIIANSEVLCEVSDKYVDRAFEGALISLEEIAEENYRIKKEQLDERHEGLLAHTRSPL